MNVIGIIAEYNPFHKGHKYHIDKIKEQEPDALIIAVTSSCFTQRGNISVLNKWDKTKIALDNGIDLVIELPFVYSSQSADIFAKGALLLLNALKVNKIIFGSESNDIEALYKNAKAQVNNIEFDEKVKQYLKEGWNYPTCLSKTLKDFGIEKTDNPNDLLGISYIKEIIKNNYDIKPVCIKRTNNYHGNNKGEILSASEIREKVKNNESVNKYINYSEDIIYKDIEYFKLLKYQVNNNNNLENILTVDEGIENRIKKVINNSNSLEEVIKGIKTKRYTYNKINRMFIHILTDLMKNEKELNIDYIRVLGFNNKGRNYLNKIKNNCSLKIITKYRDIDSRLLEIENKVNTIYSIIVNDNSLMKRELERPIYKKEL